MLILTLQFVVAAETCSEFCVDEDRTSGECKETTNAGFCEGNEEEYIFGFDCEDSTERCCCSEIAEESNEEETESSPSSFWETIKNLFSWEPGSEEVRETAETSEEETTEESLDDYYTKEELENLLKEYLTDEEINSLLEGYASTTSLEELEGSIQSNEDQITELQENLGEQEEIVEEESNSTAEENETSSSESRGAKGFFWLLLVIVIILGIANIMAPKVPKDLE
tara:strand:+ start:1362 stop:2039 length:678 start_codon:yes stop_codon:yes gene_type:complete